MIFSRTSHTLIFVGGILLLVAVVAERGALDTVSNGAQGEQLASAGQDQQADGSPAAGSDDMIVEEVDGWDDDMVIDDIMFDDAMAMPDMDADPDPVIPDNTGEDIYDPDAGVFSPEPDGDW